jgi:hypothetical protein
MDDLYASFWAFIPLLGTHSLITYWDIIFYRLVSLFSMNR